MRKRVWLPMLAFVVCVVFSCSERLLLITSADTSADSSAKQVMIDTLTSAEVEALVLRDVPNEVFYKDIFLDAGIGLTSRTHLHAADSIGWSLEGVSFSRSNASPEEKALQTGIISGTPEDMNGRLLYPDGQPRYRVLFVCGGDSRGHASSLDSIGRAHMRTFVRNGGSYVGACAGAFLAASGYDSHVDYPNYLALWPAAMQHTGLTGVYTGMYVAEDSPLLAYADFGGDGYIEGIRHNKGGYPQSLPEGTTILATYDYPGKKSVHRQPSAWSYKKDKQTGRVVMEGSHPEEARSGERRAFTEALIRYAADGVGTVSVKGILQKNRPFEMDGANRLGDLQCHHFAVYVPPGARHVHFTVESSAACDLKLRLCREHYAFPSRATQVSKGSGASQELHFEVLEAGIWYVSVQCLTTVTAIATDYGQTYVGRLDVLNGVPYAVTVTWDSYE